MVFGKKGVENGFLGPGDYEPGFKAVYKKEAAIRFGKSSREAKIRRSPGPGDYL